MSKLTFCTTKSLLCSNICNIQLCALYFHTDHMLALYGQLVQEWVNRYVLKE